MVRGFFHSIKPDVGKADAGSNKKPHTGVRGFLELWAILDYRASLGGQTGEASQPLRSPAYEVRLVCFGSPRSSRLDARANKKPRTCVRGFLELWAILDSNQ